MTANKLATPSRIAFLVALIFSVVMIFGTVEARAQATGPEKPVAGAVPGGTTSGSSSDAELWRKIRQGDSGTVVGGDKSGGMMIQSGGQDWRIMRNGPLPMYAAWVLLGTLLLLALFFALRGRIKISHGRSTQTIKRFSLVERVGHWLLASSFIILALTGLNILFGKQLLIPLLGKEAFATITIFGKYIHNYVAFAFMAGLVMIAVMWVLHNIPNRHDIMWLLRGGGMLGGGHPPAKKFNAGQKIIFWVVILCGVSISMSGWALMNPFTTEMFSSTFSFSNNWFGTDYATNLAPIQEQQYQSLWHTIMAVIMIAVIMAHIYIGSVGMEGAIDAMTSGDVDANWAREHHSLWVDEEESKAAALGNVAAEAVTTAAVATAGAVSVKKPIVASAPVQQRSAEARPAQAKTAKPKAPLVKPSVSEPAIAPSASASPAKTATAKIETPAPKKTRTTKLRATTKPKAAAKSKAKGSARAVTKNTTSAKPAPQGPSLRQTKSAAKANTKPKSAKDDLKLIKGIGPQNEQKLNAIGVMRFDDVAKWSKKEQADIGLRLAFPGRIEREDWVKQARVLAKKVVQ